MRKASGRRLSDRLLLLAITLTLGLFLLGLSAAKHDIEATDPRTDINATLAQLEAQKRQINDLAARLEEDRRLLEIRQHAIERLQAHGHPAWVADVAWDEAVDAGVPPEVGFDLIGHESDWDVDLVHLNTNQTFDYGPMQINQVMLAALGLDNPLDPAENIRAGMRHLAYLHRKYGDWHKALTAYNRGEAGMEAWLASRGTARSAYSEAIRKGE